MLVFEKLSHELTNKNLMVYTELIKPNHYRIGIKKTDFMICAEIIKNYAFKVVNITKINNNQLDYYFTNHSGGRDFLLTLSIEMENDSSSITSIVNWFPNSEYFEKLLSTDIVFKRLKMRKSELYL